MVKEDFREGEDYFSEEIEEPILKWQKVFLWTVFVVGILVVLGGIGSAVECPSGWTFIDKAEYNVCYLPNYIKTSLTDNSFNITDNLNNTLLSYRSEQTTVFGGDNYYANFSSLRRYLGQDYLVFEGNNSGRNDTAYGIIYFLPDKIVLSGSRRMYGNDSGNERVTFYNFNTTDFIKADGSKMINIGGSGVFFTSTLVKALYNNGTINYTIQAHSNRILLNRTYGSSYLNNNNINLTQERARNTTSTVTGLIYESSVQQRKENITELIYYNGGNPNINNGNYIDSFWRLDSVIIFNFGQDYYEFGDVIANDTVASGAREFYTGLAFSYFDDGCATNLGNYLVTCSPWRATNNFIKNYYTAKVTKNNYFNDLIDLRNIHLNLLFLDNTTYTKGFMVDYDFLVPTNQGLITDVFNHTHIRLVSDNLRQLVNYPNNTQSINHTITWFIDFLQNATRINNHTNTLTIPHSVNSQYWFENATVLNLHSSGTTALISAKQKGYNVDNNKLNGFIETTLNLYPLMFNESYGNQSYYGLTSTGEYHTAPWFGSIVYVKIEQQDYTKIYLYSKNETARIIAQRKLDEINKAFNGTANLCSHSSCSNESYANHFFQLAKAYYQNLSIEAFKQLNSSNPYVPNYDNYNDGWEKIPDSLEFVNIFYPIFLMKDNRTFFIDEEDSLEFITPAYAMINDFKYDQSIKGMKIPIKWAFTTTGNFSNLSTSSYNHFYSPQQARFIVYNETLTWTATTDVETFWTGNISTSTTMRLQETPFRNQLRIDNEIIGDSNDTLWFSTSTSTQKTISSNLTDAITATVVVNSDGCNMPTISYTSNTGLFSKTLIKDTDFICSNNRITISSLNGIQSGTNTLTINYLSISGGGGGGGIGGDPIRQTDVFLCNLTHKYINEHGQSYSFIDSVKGNYSWTEVRRYIDNWQPYCSDIIKKTLNEDYVCNKVFHLLIESSGNPSYAQISNLKYDIGEEIQISSNLLSYYSDNYETICKFINKTLPFEREKIGELIVIKNQFCNLDINKSVLDVGLDDYIPLPKIFEMKGECEKFKFSKYIFSIEREGDIFRIQGVRSYIVVLLFLFSFTIFLVKDNHKINKLLRRTP